MTAPTPLAAQLAQASEQIVRWHERTLELEATIRNMKRREQSVVIVKRNIWPDSPEQLAEDAARRSWRSL